MVTQEALKAFAELLEQHQVEHLKCSGLGCEANLHNAKTSIKAGKKYTKIDVGGGGKYMVVNETGEIFGIKAYGVIHRGHRYGTLDTINQWNWGNYTATPKH